MNIAELKTKTPEELTEMATALNIEGASGLRKQDLIYAILQAQTEKTGNIFARGVLEILPDGFGFLRSPDFSYLPGPDESHAFSGVSRMPMKFNVIQEYTDRQNLYNFLKNLYMEKIIL